MIIRKGRRVSVLFAGLMTSLGLLGASAGAAHALQALPVMVNWGRSLRPIERGRSCADRARRCADVTRALSISSPRRSCRSPTSSRTGSPHKEVAAQLFLSPRTIEAHLRSIYAKLGITSRTQLARLSLVQDAVGTALAV